MFSITCLITWRNGGKQGGRGGIYLHSPGIVQEPCLGLHPWRQMAVKTKKEKYQHAACFLHLRTRGNVLISNQQCNPTKSKVLISFSYQVYWKANQGRWLPVMGNPSASVTQESYLMMFNVASIQEKPSHLRELKSLWVYRFPFSLACELVHSPWLYTEFKATFNYSRITFEPYLWTRY